MNDMTCEIDENFIGIGDNILSAEDCKQECHNNSTGCKAYSFYGPNGAPFRNTCLLFSGCMELSPVEDCVSEEIECSTSFCSAFVEGTLGDNIIDIKPLVSETACEEACEVEEHCHFFTYYFSNATVYPSSCFLLSEIQGPITACQDESCITKSSNCEYSSCALFDDDILFAKGIVITGSKEIDLLTIGPCSANGLLSVVVGGGGSGSYSGSGSGYIRFQELQFSRPYVQFKALVGRERDQSTLSTMSYEISDIVVTAWSGGDGQLSTDGNGGDGFSGGGAAYGGDGGSNGGDGGNSTDGTYRGGKGSGLDLNSIPLAHFELR